MALDGVTEVLTAHWAAPPEAGLTVICGARTPPQVGEPGGTVGAGLRFPG